MSIEALVQSLARPEIVAMKPYSSARKEAPDTGILLNANEAPEALLVDDPATARLNRYPDPQPAALVRRLAALYGVAENRVLATRGSDEGIDLLTRVFCRAGQDAILHCPPTFGMYRIAAQAQGAAVVDVPRRAEAGFALDAGALLAAFEADPRIRLVFLTSPNNPTGDLVPVEILERLLERARGRALVVLDEAYSEFCDQPSACALIDRHPHLVVLRTLSKAWASAGLRCGAVLARPELLDLLRRVIAPYPLPSPVVSLALRVLEEDMQQRQQAMLDRLGENKRRLVGVLESRPFVRDILRGRANFVLIRADRAEELLSFCARHGVVLRGFPSDPALRGYIRISVGTAEEIDSLSDVLDAWENAS